jgi:acetolactate synthase-1/2/3 large subunit
LDEIKTTFDAAITSMISGRMGPVLIDFPVNLQMTSNLSNFSFSITNTSEIKQSINIEHTLKLHKRPIVVVGNGCRTSIQNVKEWIEKSNIPFVTSWGGNDLFEHTHPLRIGNFGVYGDRIGNYALQNSDVVLILGSRMDTRETGGNLSLCARESVKIMVDIDEQEIHKLNERGFKIDIPILSSVDEFIKINTPVSFDNDWIQRINSIKESISIEPMRKAGDIYDILRNIQLPDECIIIPDCGGNLVWTMQSMSLRHKQKLFSNFGNSSMG